MAYPVRRLYLLTVRAVPRTNVRRDDMLPLSFSSSSTPKKSFNTSGTSPASTMIGRSTNVLSRLVYHDSNNALSLTTGRLCLMMMEWVAVRAELAIPKLMPTTDTFAPSRKTPTKNPRVTMLHAAKILREGRVCRNTNDATTVKGRTNPRAT